MHACREWWQQVGVEHQTSPNLGIQACIRFSQWLIPTSSVASLFAAAVHMFVIVHLHPLHAGLVASTSLTSLVLKEVTLPQRSGPHMFARPGLRLPHLQELHLEGVKDFENGGFPDVYLTGDDVASIATCCTGGGLRELTLRCVTKWDRDNLPDYTVFSALTTLTSLSVSGCVEGVDTLVQLRALDIFHADVRDETLAGIALNLTRLTTLRVWNCDLSARAGSNLIVCFDNSGSGDFFCV